MIKDNLVFYKLKISPLFKQYLCLYWTNRWQKRRFDPRRSLGSGTVTLFKVTEKKPPLVCGAKNQNPISEHRSELHQHNAAASGET